MAGAIGFGLALALAASTGQPVNLNLPPPPPLPAQSPPPPAWSNFQAPVPQRSARPAWLPSWVFPDVDRFRYPVVVGGGGRSIFGNGSAHAPRGGNR